MTSPMRKAFFRDKEAVHLCFLRDRAAQMFQQTLHKQPQALHQWLLYLSTSLHSYTQHNTHTKRAAKKESDTATAEEGEVRRDCVS